MYECTKYMNSITVKRTTVINDEIRVGSGEAILVFTTRYPLASCYIALKVSGKIREKLAGSHYFEKPKL